MVQKKKKKGRVVVFVDVTQLRIQRQGDFPGLSGQDPKVITYIFYRRKQSFHFTQTEEVEAETRVMQPQTKGAPASAGKQKRQGTNSPPNAPRGSVAPPTP